MKFWLLTPTPNQVLGLAMLKTILSNKKKTKKKKKSRGRKKVRNNNNSKPQQKSNHRLQHVVDYRLGTASRKEHKYSSFCWSIRRCEKK